MTRICAAGHGWADGDNCPVCGAPPAGWPSVPPTAPQAEGRPAGCPRIPGLEVLEELGRGGMGAVFLARQPRPERLVAVKVVTGGDLSRYRTEADALGRISHPNIVPIFAAGTADGVPYLVLEYAPGGSLDDKLRAGPLPALDAAAVIQTLAGAVHAAHEAGVLHRDLKPGNVLLMADGTPKVSDFGLAKWLDQGATVTGSGLLGTPAYMAPEQAMGGLTGVGRRADVYGLGALLYACLTGRPPFVGETIQSTVTRVIAEDPVPPSRLNPAVPADLEAVCLKCLEKKPARRYETARELADDLRRFLAREPVRARPVGPAGRLLRWAERRPALAALTGALACLVLLTLGGAVWAALVFRQQAGENDRLAEAERARPGELQLWGVRGGRELPLFPQQRLPCASVRRGADGRLAVGSDPSLGVTGFVWIYDGSKASDDFP